ncbi:MAG: FAD-dependent oxidoreductase [Dermatophilaceae bacterium]
MSETPAAADPLADRAERRVVIVGAGPSGLFAAQSLVAQTDLPVRVDIIDRLPTPYGLLRYGVAPDHTSIKSVATALARTFDDPRVRFFGQVQFGADTTRDELLGAYDAVVYAVGASEDAELGIPGEDLAGSLSAREFVAWYSGHPDAQPQDLSGVRAAATIGVGNVAVDVARVLVKSADELDTTDMPDAVLDELRRHEVTDVWLIGRRGPHHASFTTVELRELVSLPGLTVTVTPDAFDGIPEEGLDRRTKANVEIIREAAARGAGEGSRRLHLAFWRKPVSLEGDGHVERLLLEHTRLDDDGRVVGTGEFETVPVQRVLRSIGYRAVPPPGVPFDERASVVRHVEGRVVDEGGAVQPGEYVVGWIKRGPVGVIGTNKSDAAQTVRHLVADLAGRAPRGSETDLLEVWRARGIEPTTFAQWQAIDAAEISKGAARGRARTKIDTWQELLEVCRAQRETAG